VTPTSLPCANTRARASDRRRSVGLRRAVGEKQVARDERGDTCLLARAGIRANRRRRGCMCPIPVVLEWAVSSYGMAPVVAEQERGRRPATRVLSNLEREAGFCSVGSSRKRRAHPVAGS
jgi:hypothetical protein